MTTELVNIGLTLRFLAAELGQLIGSPLSSVEIEKAITDSEDDQVNSKDYLFLKVGRVEVSGHVDEYEPETTWITVVGNRKIERRLDEIIELADIDARRAARSEEDA